MNIGDIPKTAIQLLKLEAKLNSPDFLDLGHPLDGPPIGGWDLTEKTNWILKMFLKSENKIHEIKNSKTPDLEKLKLEKERLMYLTACLSYYSQLSGKGHLLQNVIWQAFDV